jgi:hypothetical protein
MTLITVIPGPTLRVYRDGELVAEVELSRGAALTLLAKLAMETAKGKE